MNKRISTLLVVALATMSFTANAQYSGDRFAAAPGGQPSIVTNGSRYYALSTVAFGGGSIGKVLTVAVDPATGVACAKVVAMPTTGVDAALWTIGVQAVQGSNRFVLTNKATGATLTFDPATAVAASAGGVLTEPTWAAANTPASFKVAGLATQWTWYSAPNAPIADLNALSDVKCAFRTDSTMALAADANGYVFAYKYANNNAPSVTTPIKLQAIIPGTMPMTPADLNVLEKTVGNNTLNYFTLASNRTTLIGKDSLLNRPYKAVNSIGGATATQGYVFLQNADLSTATVTNDYAHVDTAFYVGTGKNLSRWYMFENGPKTAELAQAAYEFMITRDLFKDSLLVHVKTNALFKYDAAGIVSNTKTLHWQTPQNDSEILTYSTVSVVKLTDDTEVLTLYTPNSPENLLFPTPAAAADTTLTTVDNGLYYIMNQKGQYLAAPIYNASADNYAKYDYVNVNKDEQNVAHMPAYQWVVLKNDTTSKSKVSMVNREFPTVNFPNAQIRKNGTTLYIGTDSMVFVKITDKAILGDSLLGYKNFKRFDLETAKYKYTFNYLNPYVMDKYIAKDAKDSLVNVLNGKTAFTITADGVTVPYGYQVPSNSPISGLKTLYRQGYSLSVNGQSLQKNTTDGNKYFISKYGVNGAVMASGDQSTFYFKENNDLGNGKCYYALVDYKKIPANSSSQTPAYIAYSKAGVSDTDLSAFLKNQVWSETRTSAFLIENDTTPLYRRFNNVKLNNGENAKDSTVVLKFKETVRGNEYLQDENNDNLLNTAWEVQNNQTIDYAGIWTADAAKLKGRGLGLTVDTAFVGDGIKPMYLISVARKDQLHGTDTIPCDATNHQHVDANSQPCDSMHCVHATFPTASFQYGKYLVSFADSLSITKDQPHDAAFMDVIKNGYTRIGFVPAIHYNDTLYILKSALTDKDLASMNITAFVKKVKAGTEKSVIGVKPLNNNKFSSVKWAMRYVNAKVNAPYTATEGEINSFLIESDGNQVIAPTKGAWMKIQNGCLTLTKLSESTFEDAKTGGDGALIFNVEKYGADDAMVTDAATVTASDFAVIAGQGQVTINGAAGKKVVVSNILGQTVANTVLTSDNATIATPAGVVVVAVEGEAAVKAIVK